MMLKDAKHPACLGVTKRDHAAGEERFRGFLDVLEETTLGISTIDA